MKFKLPELPYEMDALEPYISYKTLEYHYGKHCHAYVESLNNLVKGTKYINYEIETIIKIADGPIYNFAAQIWNHIFYFECLRPANKNTIKDTFSEAINRDFGSFGFFKSAFTKAVDALFGVGWIWLVVNQQGVLEIMPKSNAGNPLRIGYIPIMNCDVWEHAYYLDYQNRCCEYINAFWNLVNWELIEKRYIAAIKRQDTSFNDEDYST